MQKKTTLIRLFAVLFGGIVMTNISLYAKSENPLPFLFFMRVQKVEFSKEQDKNLLKGNWQNDNASAELHISELLDNGLLQVNYFNSKLIFIEKAGWTNSSDVLRLFVIYRQSDNPGYSLSLNYLDEKDMLVGAYIDGSDNKSYPVSFKRIK
jgi:hypothetical protein